jgi:hypothetical protein
MRGNQYIYIIPILIGLQPPSQLSSQLIINCIPFYYLQTNDAMAVDKSLISITQLSL